MILYIMKSLHLSTPLSSLGKLQAVVINEKQTLQACCCVRMVCGSHIEPPFSRCGRTMQAMIVIA